MAILDTGDLNLPDQILDPWLGKVQHGSAVAALSGAIPMKFGPGESITFDIGEAEYVAEGGNKGSTTFTPTTYSVGVFKFHKTVRWTQEVKWASEDHQMKVIEEILAQMQPSLSRALDFGVFHGINPTGGTAVTAMSAANLDALVDAEVEVVAGDKPYVATDAAKALVLANGYVPSDIALDPAFAAGYAGLRSTATEQLLYPGLRLSTEISDLEGQRASVSRTVGAVGVAASPTNVKAYVGDFSSIRWGIQRVMPLEMIEYGDPDGQGDLKRTNQVAFRAEVVYGWGIAAGGDALARIVDEIDEGAGGA